MSNREKCAEVARRIAQTVQEYWEFEDAEFIDNLAKDITDALMAVRDAAIEECAKVSDDYAKHMQRASDAGDQAEFPASEADVAWSIASALRAKAKEE